MSGVFDLEYSALKMLIGSGEAQREEGVTLWLAGLSPEVLATVQRSPLGETLGRERHAVQPRNRGRAEYRAAVRRAPPRSKSHDDEAQRRMPARSRSCCKRLNERAPAARAGTEEEGRSRRAPGRLRHAIPEVVLDGRRRPRSALPRSIRNFSRSWTASPASTARSPRKASENQKGRSKA